MRTGGCECSKCSFHMQLQPESRADGLEKVLKKAGSNKSLGVIDFCSLILQGVGCLAGGRFIPG